MNKRRLLKLADLLEADAENKKGIKFDLNTVGSAAGGGEFIAGEKEPSVSCGTAACAMGLAAISGVFRRQGLSYAIQYGEVWCTVDGLIKYYAQAAQEMFDLADDEARLLFDPDFYDGEQTGARGERRVAKRIRDFVAGKVAPVTEQ